MAEPTIICPNCKTEIKLTESLAAPLVEATRREMAQQIAQRETAIGRRELALRDEKAAIAAAQASIDEVVAAKLKAGEVAIAEAEAKKAKLALETDISNRDRLISDLSQTIQQLNEKLSTAQTAEVEFRRKERELNDKIREADLAVEKRIAESLAAVESKARQRADEDNRLKIAEKDKLLADAQRQVTEMKRRIEQGSQQLQGEVQELALESLLGARFPYDTIEPVPKGEHGGDVLQRVVGPLGQPCGTILWESKRTKNWSDSWLPKLREDQRTAKADLAIIVSTVLPKEIENFDLVDGVWVANPRSAIAVAVALRHSLIEVTAARQAGEGQQTKMEMIYQYLTGPNFRHRVEAIVERFADMQEDLDRERKTMTRLWAKREQQIHAVVEATAGMYGDLQGIAGKTLQEIEGLGPRALPGPTEQ